jgi:peptide/nickel transport system ATP-binding protein
MAGDVLLRVEDLTLHYRSERGIVRAVDGVSFDVRRGEALVLLGESGCGKSSLAKALMRLMPRNLHHFSGRVELDGTDTMAYPEERFRREVRWLRMSLVMQAAMNALNPVVRVGEQVAEPLRIHLGWSRTRAFERAAQAFAQVGVASDFLQRYPFELSGGMRQRVVLAMALVTEPELVIMDEPTSALDVLTQASIMNVLKRIKRELGTSFILITHDVATSSEIADRVALMYAGQIAELADGVLPRAGPPLRPAADGERAAAAPGPPARTYPRRAAEHDRPADGLPLCRALPGPLRALRGEPAAAADRRTPPGALLAATRGKRCDDAAEPAGATARGRRSRSCRCATCTPGSSCASGASFASARSRRSTG